VGRFWERASGSATFELNDRGITGSLEELVNAFVHYCEGKEHINTIGIGERMHGTGVLEDVLVPYLLPALARAGYKQLLMEAILRDAEPELELAYGMLDGYRRSTRNERVDLLRTRITAQPSFTKLKINYEGLLAGAYGIDILLPIVTAHELGIRLHGMIYWNQCVADDYEMARRIADGGRERALRLKKNGKLLIYAGDVHVVAKQLQFILVSPDYKNPTTLSFGAELLNDPEVNYMNLTILGGTVESIKNAYTDTRRLFELSGYKFYLKMFGDLKAGMARYIHVEEEGTLRGILLYNNSARDSQ
jgi:hypothetical protein